MTRRKSQDVLTSNDVLRGYKMAQNYTPPAIVWSQAVFDAFKWYSEITDEGRAQYHQAPHLFNPSYIRNLAPELAGLLGRSSDIELFSPRVLILFALCGDPDLLIAQCIYPVTR